MNRPVLYGTLAVLFINMSCNKTVVSDKVVPVATATEAPEPLKKGVWGGEPDTKVSVRLTNAKCEAERKTAFSIKVQGLKNGTWIPINCSDKDKAVQIDAKKGYCNILQLKADVSFVKANNPSENYTRSSEKASDKVFFQVDQKAGSAGAVAGLNIHFEDTNDDYWNKAYMVCMKDPNATIAEEPITLIKNQPCKNIIKGYTAADGTSVKPAVDWNDFEFTVESSDVQFTVEGFSDIGCSPN